MPSIEMPKYRYWGMFCSPEWDMLYFTLSLKTKYPPPG
jgi:hypothetical protein